MSTSTLSILVHISITYPMILNVQIPGNYDGSMGFFLAKNSSRNGSVLETAGKPVHHVLHEAVNDQSKICLLRVKPDALLTSDPHD